MAKIMLVEDDHTMRSLMQTLLEMEGFTVVTGAAHAEALMQDLHTEKPDLLVMDVRLAGGISGIDLLKTLREDPELHNIRVIMTSGMDYSEASLAAGADAFLQKPYMVDKLLNLIHQNLNAPN